MVTLEGVDLQRLREESGSTELPMDDSSTDLSFTDSRVDLHTETADDFQGAEVSLQAGLKTQPFQVDPININLSEREHIFFWLGISKHFNSIFARLLKF